MHKTLTKKTITLRIDQKRKNALDLLANSLDRDRSYIINQAIDEYLNVHQWQIAEIQKALQEARSGKFATEKEVQSFFKQWSHAAYMAESSVKKHR